MLTEHKDIYGVCDNCDDVLISVLGNPEDALIVHFEGGYGCYIDPMDVDYNTATLCKACADTLSVAFPKLAEIMRRG